jgi:hypothetical protein
MGIGKHTCEKVPNVLNQPLDYVENINPQSIFMTPTDSEEILSIANKMKGKRSEGHDGISTWLLKKCIKEIATPLTHIINKSLENGTVPEKMKITKS